MPFRRLSSQPKARFSATVAEGGVSQQDFGGVHGEINSPSQVMSVLQFANPVFNWHFPEVSKSGG